MSKKQKQIAYIAAAAIGAWLLYSYIRGRQVSNQSTSSGSSGTPVDTSASDFASLAGQEQGDVAALQNQNSQLFGQEQSDVAALRAQEGQDVSTITGTLAGITASVDGFTSSLTGVTSDIAALATGEQQINRRMNSTVKVKKGGSFADYYKRVTGKTAPTTISPTSFIYEAYKAGVKAAALKPPAAHPSAPKNTSVAHPNGNHTQQTGTHKKLPSGGAGIGAGKTKPSGARK
jgi:hypothetical protein